MNDEKTSPTKPRLSGAEYEARLKDDFYFFVRELWREVRNDEHTPLGDPDDPEQWVDPDVAQWVQHGPKLRGVLAWRQFSKSTFISICYSLWLLLRHREHKVCVISKSQDMAARFLYTARHWIDVVWFLNHLAPSDREVSRDSAKGFDVKGCRFNPNPSFVAKGIDGQITGSRAHTIIADDIEDKDNCQTVVQRQKLAEKTNEFNAIIFKEPKIKPKNYFPSEILIVGTFHNEDSVYKELAKRNIEFRTWPIIYPSEGEDYIGLAPKVTERLAEGLGKPGEILAPHRVTAAEVQRQMAVGDRYFRLQYKLQANVRETNRYPLLLSNLIIFDSGPQTGPLEIVWGRGNANGPNSNVINDIELHGFNTDRLYGPVRQSPPNEWVKYSDTACSVDPGGSGNKSMTAWCIGSSLNGAIFAHHLRAQHGGAANIPEIALDCFKHRAKTVHLEGNLAGAYDLESNPFAASLQVALNRLNRQQGDPECPEGWSCLVRVIHSVGQKELRIIGALETPITSHTLILSRQVISNQRLQYQISRLTNQRGCLDHYDELDCIAILVKEMAATFMQDANKGRKSRLEQRIDEEIEKLTGTPARRWHSVMGSR